jgi:hypothetical protein
MISSRPLLFLSSPPAERGERIKVRGVSMTSEISRILLFPSIAPSPSSGQVSAPQAGFAGD